MIATILIGVGIGALAGAGLGRLSAKACADGACPMTATPRRGAAWGGLLGLLFALAVATPQASSAEAAKEGKPATTEAKAPAITEVSTPEEFKKLVLDRKGKALAFFHATWCGPCKRFAPTFEKVARAHAGKAAFVKLDIDKATKVTAASRIRGVPTVIFFDNGKEVKRFVGGASEETLSALLAPKRAEAPEPVLPEPEPRPAPQPRFPVG